MLERVKKLSVILIIFCYISAAASDFSVIIIESNKSVSKSYDSINNSDEEINELDEAKNFKKKNNSAELDSEHLLISNRIKNIISNRNLLLNDTNLANFRLIDVASINSKSLTSDLRESLIVQDSDLQASIKSLYSSSNKEKIQPAVFQFDVTDTQNIKKSTTKPSFKTKTATTIILNKKDSAELKSIIYAPFLKTAFTVNMISQGFLIDNKIEDLGISAGDNNNYKLFLTTSYSNTDNKSSKFTSRNDIATIGITKNITNDKYIGYAFSLNRTRVKFDEEDKKRLFNTNAHSLYYGFDINKTSILLKTTASFINKNSVQHLVSLSASQNYKIKDTDIKTKITTIYNSIKILGRNEDIFLIPTIAFSKNIKEFGNYKIMHSVSYSYIHNIYNKSRYKSFASQKDMLTIIPANSELFSKAHVINTTFGINLINKCIRFGYNRMNYKNNVSHAAILNLELNL